MRNSPMIEFPAAEFEGRIARLCRSLKAKGLDGVILTTKENTRYFCGLQSIIWSSKVSTPGLAVVTAAGNVRMVGSASAVETIRYTGCVEDADVYHFNRNGLPGIPSTYPAAVIETIRKAGLENARVGMEFGQGFRIQLQIPWFEEICQSLPNMQMVDAGDVIWACRAIKSKLELEKIRKIAILNEESYRAAFAATELGKTTEMEFFRLFAQEAFRRHAENVPPITVRFGPDRFPYPNCPPSDDVVIENIPHAALLCDGSAYVDGYFADMCCCGVVGGLDAVQQSLCDAAAAALDYALTQMRPGVSIGALVESVHAFAQTTKAADFYRSVSCIGHSVGVDIREFPLLCAGDETKLEPGMTFCLEPQFGSAQTGLFCPETVVTLTETGCELLSAPNVKPYILK